MKPGNIKSDRSAIADILKVCAILAVVFIHGSGVIPFSASAIDFSQSQVDLAANSLRFCVPVFIFLWAYFMEKSIIKSGTGILFNRFLKLFIPFAFWSLIYCVIKADIKSMTIMTIIIKYWTGYGWSGQYYFIILFQFIATFPLWRCITGKLIKISSLLLLILSILFFIVIAYAGWSDIRIIERISDRIFIYWWPYVLLGILYARKNIFNFPPIPVIIKISAIALIPLEIFWMRAHTISPYALPSVFIASILLISLLESKLKYQELPPRIAKPVSVLANFTLGIYCLNPLVILVNNYYFNIQPLQFPGSSIVTPIFSTLLVSGVCIVIITLLKKIKLDMLVST